MQRGILIILLLGCFGTLLAQSQPTARKTLLQQLLPVTRIDEVRIDEIMLTPGQAAPLHYHPGEVYGYVVEGDILYQPEGETVAQLKSGDSFREAAGKRISVFKNASGDRPAKFIAVYLLRKNQEPIRFIKE
jgi:quercetin dioxygenase-like cupin family protein